MITKRRYPVYAISGDFRTYLHHIKEVTYFLWILPIHEENIYDD